LVSYLRYEAETWGRDMEQRHEAETWGRDMRQIVDTMLYNRLNVILSIYKHKY
jgi:hypothetical protein